MSSSSEQYSEILRKAVVPVGAAVLVAIIASIAFYFVDKKQSDNLSKSYNQFFLLKKEAEVAAKDWTPDAEAAEDVKKDKAAKKDVAPEVKKAAYAPIIEKLKAHVQANQGNQVAVESALLVVDLGAQYNDSEVGIETLKQALNGLGKDHFLFAIGQAELGTLLAKNNKCSEATQAWESVINAPAQAYLADNLRLKAGVCYESMGMLDKAEKLYQDILDKNPNSSSARTAKKFLLHIQFVKNKGDADDSKNNKNG